MKLIIDVPKGTYEAVKVGIINQVLEYKVWNAIKNGTPLDNVKAEIEKMPTDYCGGYVGLDKKEVLQIIDNIGKGDNK